MGTDAAEYMEEHKDEIEKAVENVTDAVENVTDAVENSKELNKVTVKIQEML
eukprot:CAMPEP_0205818064 /NCGR_PEP_ID=MMETSP0205-20121125/25297_1 /ASSEMBLY_ACC=CAM_ASM_000278 /TAXON_ID=36767 /ORGANISM="Euplotes focardii, Strain TN1" /LENGTH=51 /DNA_ID=CAMNT_0053109927 /DNA_START=398 /DNA_END=549 /DNA_ORIENTATION=-